MPRVNGLIGREAFAARLGRLLKRERLDQVMTRTALAGKVGVSRGAIQFWENGEMIPGLEHFIRLSAALGLQPGSILDRALEQDPIKPGRKRMTKVSPWGPTDGDPSTIFRDALALVPRDRQFREDIAAEAVKLYLESPAPRDRRSLPARVIDATRALLGRTGTARAEGNARVVQLDLKETRSQ